MNALSEMGVDYIDTEKEDSSQLSAQEAVVKSAKLGKKGQFIVQVKLHYLYMYFLTWEKLKCQIKLSFILLSWGLDFLVLYLVLLSWKLFVGHLNLYLFSPIWPCC